MRGSAAGFTEWLLFHLWKKNDLTKQSCPFVLIPDTIIYRWGRPFFWYFTTHSGELLRKSKNKVSHKYIAQEFLNSSVDSGLVAQYLSFEEQDLSSKATVHFFQQDSFSISHSDDFVHNREKTLSGLLQHWIEPKGDHNCNVSSALIKVIWSPLFSVLERRVNRHKIHDTDIDFYDRLVTYEGLEFNSEPESLSVPQIVSDIQKICTAIVEHIRVVSGANVSVTRLTLYFKQDANDRLWLLFCGGVQIYDLEHLKSRGPEAELALDIPQIARSKKLVAGNNYFELQTNRKPCLACNLLVLRLYPVKFNLLVACWKRGLPDPQVNKPKSQEHPVLDVSQEEACDKVPALIKRAIPDITNERYAGLKNSTKWLNSTLSVCEECYLHYTGLMLNGNKIEEKPKIVNRRTLSMAKLEEILAVDSVKPTEKPKSRGYAASHLSSPQGSSHLHIHPTPTQPKLVLLKPTPKLHGRFMSKRVPQIRSIYSTRSSSRRGSLTPMTALPSMEPADMVRETIRSLKLCLLDGL